MKNLFYDYKCRLNKISKQSSNKKRKKSITSKVLFITFVIIINIHFLYEFIRTIFLFKIHGFKIYFIVNVVCSCCVAIMSIFIFWSYMRIQKKVELGLHEKINQITDNMLDMLIKVDLFGKYKYISPSIKECLGYEIDDIMNTEIFDIVHPEDLDRVKSVFQKMIKKEIQKPVRLEVRIKKRDGKFIWVETINNTISNSEGKVIGGISSARDITDRRKAESALIESEEKYRKLIEFLPDAIFVHCNNKIEFVNPVCMKIMGVSNEKELLGRDLNEFIHLDYKKLVNDRIHFMKNKNKILPFIEEKITTHDGTVLDVEVGARPLQLEGEKKFLCVVRDISERKRVEELKSKMDEKTKELNQVVEYDKLKTEFFANMSHELKTPLNVILSALQMHNLMLKDVPEMKSNEKIGKYTGMMRQNCYRLIRLINNLIDVTKIDSGYYKFNFENCNIINVIENITLSVAGYTEMRGINLIFDTEVEDKTMACDPHKIERIMLNLLSNAIKFTDSGGSIFVNIKEEKNNIIVVIKDTGIGIPQDKIKTIFDRFTQVDKSFSRNQGGSGIGLSLVKSLVELHGGKISLKSEIGQGSEFSIKFPINTIKEDEQSFKTSCTEEENIQRIQVEFSDIYI